METNQPQPTRRKSATQIEAGDAIRVGDSWHLVKRVKVNDHGDGLSVFDVCGRRINVFYGETVEVR